MTNVPIILQADSYKYSHFRLFPNGITNNNSYIESRGIDEQSMLPKDAEVVFFGLQILLKEYLTVRVTKQDIARAKALIPAHGEPFNEEDWNIIVDEHDGFLPIVIFALPEGAVIHPGVAMVQVRATDPRFAWLASFVETTILRAVWYPSTVATVSREGKKIIKRFLDKTSDDPSQIMFKLHDFGGRGVSSSESAQIGGVAHLVNFMGTDTVEALVAAQDYYNVEGAAAYSVPASEHSTMTSWGRENEALAIENAIDVFAGDYPIVSIVSDSYDIFNAVRVIYPALKEKIVASGSTVVVRPDSGDPITTPTTVVKLLAESFGTTTRGDWRGRGQPVEWGRVSRPHETGPGLRGSRDQEEGQLHRGDQSAAIESEDSRAVPRCGWRIGCPGGAGFTWASDQEQSGLAASVERRTPGQGTREGRGAGRRHLRPGDQSRP